MAEAGLLAGLELVVRLVVVLVHVLQEVRSRGRREWMRKIGVDHNNEEYWNSVELGDRRTELFELNLRPIWPDILVIIRNANRNTATGKDGVHINVLKAMVLEECMAEVARENPRFQRPDNVRVDLPEDKLPCVPLTPMGKAFYSLILNVWETGCIPKQWSEVQIVNLHKGGSTEDVNNYRGISLISCAFKVLLSLMATRLSKVSEETGLISKEQSGFRKREEAVAQATALAEIVRRRWIKGKATYGAFIDFKKAYDSVMIHPNFSHPFPSPLQPHLLQYMHQHQHQPYNQFQPSQ